MNAVIIVIVLCIVVGIFRKLGKRADKIQHYNENRGSRAVEQEEWERWSRQLFDEYKELTGLDIPYPEIKFDRDNFTRAYCNAFNGTNEFPRELKRWKDTIALEELRQRHNLPTDDDVYAIREWSQGKKILHRPPIYVSLSDIISPCVYRAVHERGYKYGGIDWERQEQTRQEWQRIKAENAWKTNDPTQKG